MVLSPSKSEVVTPKKKGRKKKSASPTLIVLKPKEGKIGFIKAK